MIDIIKSYIDNKDYGLLITKEYLYIYNYDNLIYLNDNIIKIIIDKKTYLIKGSNFKITRNELRELKINGKLESININD